MATQPRVLIGHIGKAHGLKGAVRLYPSSERSNATAASLSRIKTVYVDDVPHVLLRSRPEKAEVLIELEGIFDRNSAESLRGRAVTVDRDELPKPAKDELYLADLVGCNVVAPDGAQIGIVRGSIHTGAHEVLVVESARGERLLPYVPAYVVSLDLAAQQLIYDAPPGLLDLDEAEEA